MRSPVWQVLVVVLAASGAGPPRQEVSLNGTWEMARVDSLEKAGRPSQWKATPVPGTVQAYDPAPVWFRRAFQCPAGWRGRRVFVRFDGVKYNSRVLVNGKRVGGCFNGYDAFELDVTGAVRFGEKNELLVGVQGWTGVFAGEPVTFGKGLSWEQVRGVPKDRVLAPVGGRYAHYGIWADVTLRSAPPVHVAEGFARPSVRRQRLEVDVTVRNSGPGAFTGPLIGRLYAWNKEPRDRFGRWPVAGKPLAVLAEAQVAVAAGQTQAVTLRLDNPPLELWWPHTPRLYVLELQVGEDVWRERIGYRELWTQDGDFYLNGAKVHLLATSWWPPREPMGREAVAEQIRAIKRMNAVCLRTHTQPWRSLWYEVADEVGLLMVPEGAVFNDDEIYRIDDPRFWDHYAAHLQAMVRRLRNHPSVVMWSLENEFYGWRAKDKTPGEAGLARMGKVVKAADPTRPITFESDGDPGGVADVIGLHYPNDHPSRREWPNVAFWLEKPEMGPIHQNFFWADKPFAWDRRKPLYIGEYLWSPGRDPGRYTHLTGDEAYKDHRRYATRAKAFSWRMQMLAYRMAGVSGQCPWTVIEHGPLNERNLLWRAQRDMYRPLAAFLREFDSRFYAGRKVKRTVVLLNDTMADLKSVSARWALLDGNRPVAEGRRTFDMASGSIRPWPVEIAMPGVREHTALMLRLTLSVAGKERFRQDWPVEVFPTADRWSLPETSIWLHDPKAKLAGIWKRGGVRFRSLERSMDWDGSGVLVVGPGAWDKPARVSDVPIIGEDAGPAALLARRVEAGGRVLVLEQTSAASDRLPVTLTDRSSTLAFPVRPSHPVLKGLPAEAFRWWRGDHRVSRCEPQRPSRGGMRALVVTGGVDGLSHAPLLEVPVGVGVWLLCQLQVTGKLGEEPIARELLERMVRYLAGYSAPAGRTVCSGSPELRAKLAFLGLRGDPLTDWAALRWPAVQVLILQADRATLDRHGPELRSFLQAGGRVFLHRPDIAAFESIRNTLGLKLSMDPYHGPALRAEGSGPLLDAVMREDLYWLGTHKSGGWSSTPLAADMATATFAPQLKPSEGRRIEAETDVRLEGNLVTAGKREVEFASGGSGHWTVRLPKAGAYLLGMMARGTPVGGVGPVAEVFLDGSRIGTFFIASRKARLYGLRFRAGAGDHNLTVRFTNDEYRPPEDRNLYIDHFLLSPDRAKTGIESLTVPPALVQVPVGKGQLVLGAIGWDEPSGKNRARARRFICSLLTALGARFAQPGTAGVVEAERLQPTPGIRYFQRREDHVAMATGGYVEGPVRIMRAGRYRVTVWAKGTPAKGVYPIVELSLGKRVLGQVQCASDDWDPHRLTANLPAGRFRLRVRFTNDRCEPPEDRNLWLDRIEFERLP